MKYLNDKEMIENIKEYIDKDNDYAILIDGKWGSGKSYFIDNVLIPELKTLNKEYVKISLFGSLSKEEINKNIKIEKIKNIKKYGNILSAGYKYSGNIVEISKIILPKMVGKVVDKVSVKDILNKLSNLKDTIIIFDDLERSSMEINEILGIISQYIKEEECKCIIVGNQEEIGKIKLSENLELKYIATALMEKNKNDNNDKFNLINTNDLDKNIKEIFPENIEYRVIKEKVIGRTLYYQNDIKIVFNNLIEKSNISKKEQNFILENMNDLIDILKLYEHNNIRTIIFVIDIYEKIFKNLENANISEEQKSDFEKCKKDILVYTLYSSILEKTALPRKKWEGEYADDIVVKVDTRDVYITGFKFIDEVIDNGFVDKERLSGIIVKYLNIIAEKNKLKSDPIESLKYFWEQDEDTINEELKRLKDLIEDEKYKIRSYSEIIAVLTKLKHLQFKVDDIFKAMKEKIEKTKDIKASYAFDIYDGTFYSEEEEKEYNERKKYFMKLLLKSSNDEKVREINTILDDNNYGKKIEVLFTLHKYDGYFNQGILNYMNIEKLIENIRESDVKNLSDFRRVMGSLYNNQLSKEIYLLEEENLKELQKGLNLLLEDSDGLDKIKKWNLERFLELINGVIGRFEPEKSEQKA